MGCPHHLSSNKIFHVWLLKELILSSIIQWGSGPVEIPFGLALQDFQLSLMQLNALYWNQCNTTQTVHCTFTSYSYILCDTIMSDNHNFSVIIIKTRSLACEQLESAHLYTMSNTNSLAERSISEAGWACDQLESVEFSSCQNFSHTSADNEKNRRMRMFSCYLCNIILCQTFKLKILNIPAEWEIPSPLYGRIICWQYYLLLVCI